MAAGFVSKPLAALAATIARWVEYADGQQSPVHGAIQLDPATGLPLNATASISGASLWSVPSAGFVAPRYVAANPADGTGFDISGSASVVMAVEGTYTGAAGVMEQTLDESGASGWFPVLGRAVNPVQAAATSGLVSGTAYVYPSVGVRARFRMGVLSTGVFSARFARSSSVVSFTIGTAA